MFRPTDDIRIRRVRPLLPPAILMEEIPLTERASETVAEGRREFCEILDGADDRLVIVVGPCSIHDPAAGLEFAQRLRKAADDYHDELCLVMRAYFEKPRTTVGWKGLINDPHLDNSFAINEGLRRARGFLQQVTEMGLPVGTEFLDPIIPQFIADLVSWAAIGARTSESQIHRELASGLSMPVGYKNGTSGALQIAVDAVRSSAHPHWFPGVTKQGLAAIFATGGNPHCHVILRGGNDGPNYASEHVTEAVQRLKDAKAIPRIMVDCSHANSSKDHLKQIAVAESLAEQIIAGQPIFGVMMESFLEGGRQQHTPDQPLVYGQSITDACLSWQDTEPVLANFAKAVRRRRKSL